MFVFPAQDDFFLPEDHEECFQKHVQYFGNDVDPRLNGPRSKVVTMRIMYNCTYDTRSAITYPRPTAFPSSIQASNAKECQKRCQNLPGCNYFVWIGRRERDRRLQLSCFLKSDNQGESQRVGVISGPRDCQGSPAQETTGTTIRPCLLCAFNLPPSDQDLYNRRVVFIPRPRVQMTNLGSFQHIKPSLAFSACLEAARTNYRI